MEKTPGKGSVADIPKAHSRFSEEIKALLERLIEQPLTVAEILAETQERGFSLIIGLLVLPFLLPMPPGFTVILGSGVLVISAQMALGRRLLWLPPRIAKFQFPQKLAQQLLNPLKRFSRWLERFSRPRWARLTQHPHIWQINGLCISWLTLLLMSPIPFTNPIPTVGILAFVIATLEEDGLILCISYGLTGLVTALVGAIALLLWRSPALLQDFLNWAPQLLS